MKDLKANTGWFNQINTDKIGVNTPTPTSDLHITGTAQVDGTLSIGDAVSLASSGAIGGTTPTVVGQTIVWDGSKWIVGNNNSGGGEAREVPSAFVAGLTNGQSVHTINFQETYTTPPAVSTDLQVTGTDPIIPYIITDVSNGSMTVEFAKALPSGNYKLHITFGGKDVYWDQGALDKLTYSDGDVNISNNLEVGGNLTIGGETMTVNTTEMTIEDHNITIASNNPSSALTGPVLGGAGITWGNDDTTRLVYNHGSGFQFIGAGLQANEQFMLMSDVTNPALSAVTYQDLQSLPMLLKDSSLHNIDGTIVTGIGLGYQGETTSGIVVTDRGGSAAQSINFITGESDNVHNRLTVDWNGNIGIGTQTPTDRLSIVDGSIRLSGRPQFGGSPVTGDVLGTIGFEGVETSVNTTFQSEAKIQAIAEGDHSGDVAPTNLTFFTKSYNTGPGSQPSARMQINANGSMYVQDGKSIGWRYQVDGTHRGSISCDSSDNITFSNGPDAQKRVEIDRHGNLSVGVEHAASGALDVNSWGDKAPGTGSVTNGNMTVPTTEDLTGIITAGDVIRFANDNNTSDTSTKEHTVIGVNSSPSSITLSEPATYTATLHIFKKKSTLSVVSGRVGIGTADPTDGLLHLRQSGNDAIRLQREGSGSNDASIYLGHSGKGFGISTTGAIGITIPDLFIDQSGNVGIGASDNPITPLHIRTGTNTSPVAAAFTLDDDAIGLDQEIAIGFGQTQSIFAKVAGYYDNREESGTGMGLKFYTGDDLSVSLVDRSDTVAMKMLPDGSVGVGGASQDVVQASRVYNQTVGESAMSWLTQYSDRANWGGISGGSLMISHNSDVSWANVYINRYNWSVGKDRRYIDFHMNGLGTGGTISISTDGTGVVYTTGSDRRLKDNITDMTDGKDVLMQLKPRRFTWKQTETAGEGFIADELAEVIPSAVSGEPDETNEDGSPRYQGVDMSKIVPVLTNALQQALQEIEQLKSRLETLESK